MRALLVRLALVLATLAVTAPAVESQQDTTRKQPARRNRGDRNRLTATEVQQAGGVPTALDAIRLLRPWWLNPPPGRMSSSNLASETRAASEVVVYIDGLRQPDVSSSLVTVPAAKVVEVRYLDQNRAVQTYGPGHEAGVIEVTTTDKKK